MKHFMIHAMEEFGLDAEFGCTNTPATAQKLNVI